MKQFNFSMMRHGYDDHSYIDGKNDTSLTEGGVEMAKTAAKLYIDSIWSNNSISPFLYTSSKKRAVETTEIISDTMTKYKIEHDLKIEPLFRELYQGEMNLSGKSHEEKVLALETGWRIFDYERCRDNHDYKYGTPDYSKEEYNIFNSFILPPYGESQNEFSTRSRLGFLGVLVDSLRGGTTPLIVAHRGTVREVLNVVASLNSGFGTISQSPDIEMSGWRYCEIFQTSLADLSFSVQSLRRHLDKYHI